MGTRRYDAIRESVATEAVEYTLTPLADEEINRRQSTAIRDLITARMREMPARDFSEMLRTAIREDSGCSICTGRSSAWAPGLLHLCFPAARAKRPPGRSTRSVYSFPNVPSGVEPARAAWKSVQRG